MAIEDIEAGPGENPTGVNFGTVSNPKITIKERIRRNYV
jgi:hypothetical protein